MREIPGRKRLSRASSEANFHLPPLPFMENNNNFNNINNNNNDNNMDYNMDYNSSKMMMMNPSGSSSSASSSSSSSSSTLRVRSASMFNVLGLNLIEQEKELKRARSASVDLTKQGGLLPTEDHDKKESENAHPHPPLPPSRTLLSSSESVARPHLPPERMLKRMVSVEDFKQKPGGFAAAASTTLRGYLDALPSQLKLLQQLLNSSQKYDEYEPLNEKKILVALDHLYSIDMLIREQFQLLQPSSTGETEVIASRNPNPKSLREASILFKSLLFTLPNQLQRLQQLMTAGFLTQLDAHQIHLLLEEANCQKYEMMNKYCSEVMSLMAVMVKVPLAIVKFKSNAKRMRANRENMLARGFD